MKPIFKSAVFTVLLFASIFAHGQDVPFLTGRVMDNAGILSPETVNMLSDSLQAHEINTTNQVVVLTVPSLEGGSIEDFAYRAFNEWKLGQKGKDNGVLMIVVPNDRSMRIEVGYGLEGTMTDLMANRIINNVMAPKFRNGDYDGGISDGAFAVIGVLEGGEIDGIAGSDYESTSSIKQGFSGLEGPDMSIMERILFGAFIFGIIGLFTFLGIVTPGFGWFLYVFLIPFWAVFPIVVLGTKGAFILFIIYIIGFPAAKLILKNTGWYKKAKLDLKTKGHANIGGLKFSSGGSGSSWSSGGRSFSSSGFSGGGGRSGGGGSSGGW